MTQDPSTVPASPPSRRLTLSVFLFLWLVFGVHFHERDIGELHPAVIEALVERGTFSTTGSRLFVPWTAAPGAELGPGQRTYNDYSRVEGRILPTKQPGHFVLGAAVYWVLVRIGLTFAHDYSLANALISFFAGCVVAAAGGTAYFLLITRVWKYPVDAGLASTLCCALGTVILPYSASLHPDVMAGSYLAIAFFLIEAAREESPRTHPAMAGAGLLLGLTLCTSMSPLALVFAVIGYVAVSSRPGRTGSLLCGFAVGVLPLLVYNGHYFGHPLDTAYSTPEWPTARPRFDLSNSLSLISMYVGTGDISAARYMPLWYVGLAGVLVSSRLRVVTRAFLFLAPLAHVLALSTLGTFGHCQYGPRYLLAAIPFALMGLPAIVERARPSRVGTVSLLIIAWFSIAVAVIGAVGGPIYCYTSRFAPIQYFHRSFGGEVRAAALAVTLVPAALAVTILIAAPLSRRLRLMHGLRPLMVVVVLVGLAGAELVAWGVERGVADAPCFGGLHTEEPDGVGWEPRQRVNPDGLRDVSHPVERLDGVRRLVLLGDEWVSGEGPADEQGLAPLLRRLIAERGHRVELLAGGLPGWSISEQREAYRRLLRRYRPDAVLLVVSPDDIVEFRRCRVPRGVAAHSALARWAVRSIDPDPPVAESDLHGSSSSAGARRVWDQYLAELARLASEVRGDDVTFGLLLPPVVGREADSLEPVARHCAVVGWTCFDFRGQSSDVAEASLLTPLVATAGGLASPSAGDVLGGDLRPESVVPALSAPDSARRAAAAWALPRSGGCPSAASVLLARLEAEPDAGVRRDLFRAVGECGLSHASEHLCSNLSASHPALRRAAAEALARLPPSDVSPACLEGALASEDAYVRAFSVWALARVGPSAIPRLIDALRFPEALTRDGAALALLRIPGALEQPRVRVAVVEAARSGLESRHPSRRWQGARLWARLAIQDAAALPLLERVLNDGGPTRVHAIRAIVSLGASPSDAEAALRPLADDPDPQVAREATSALRAMRSQ